MRWNSTTMNVRFTVHVDGVPVPCRVSYEAISDHYGAQREHEGLALARENFVIDCCYLSTQTAGN
ncbi:MAG: DUF1488 family protein [Acidobacteriaceae bacterium]